MAVKYTIQYKDYFNNICRCDILNDNYFGSPIPLRGVEGKAVIISRDCEDDPFTTLIQTKCSISVFQDEALSIDIQELQLSQDREFKVEFYINNSIKFKGFMLADGIQNTFNQAPFEVNINATDGVSLLDGIPYDITSGAGQQRNIINLIRQCLYFPTNLNNALPIEWVNTLTNDQYPLEDDVFSGSIRFAPFGEGLYDTKDGVDIYKSCKYIVEGLLKSMQCRMVQSDGKWKIWRVNDAVTGSFELKSMTDILSDITITTSTVDVNKYIGRGGNYVFIDEDQLTTVLPALKSVSTEYKQDERDNILPNGNMDIVSLGFPIFWQSDSANLTFQSVPSIYSDRGNAVEITSTDAAGKYFEMIHPLPIDSDILYETMNIGFKFVPISGFPVDGNGIIIWTSGQRFLYVVEFHDTNGDVWTLTEFGFWQKAYYSIIPINVPGLKPLDVAQIDFNKFQNIPLIVPATLPIGQQNEPSIRIRFFVPGVCQFSIDDVYINVQQANDEYTAEYLPSKNAAKESYTQEISSSHNGFYVSNLQTSWWNAGVDKFYSDAISSGITLTNMNSQSIMRSRYMPSIMFEGSIYGEVYDYAEIYSIQTLNDKKFLPLKSEWNTETNTIKLNACEVRNDNISLEIKHNGINEQ